MLSSTSVYFAISKFRLYFSTFILHCAFHVIVSSPLPWDQGGNDFYVINQARGGQLLNFKSQGGDTFWGEMILGSQAGGGGGTALS